MPTKQELLDQASEQGLDVDDSMTKAEIEDALDASDEDDVEVGDPPTEEDVHECVKDGCTAEGTNKIGGASANELHYCGRHFPRGAN